MAVTSAEDRVQDIDTPEDWTRAERMFGVLQSSVMRERSSTARKERELLWQADLL